VCEQLVLVPRREQRCEQHDVRSAARKGGQRRIPRFDEHEVGAHLVAHDASEDLSLAQVGLDGKYEGHAA
jgi:hypothetical protein